jgi:hypothetical protein
LLAKIVSIVTIKLRSEIMLENGMVVGYGLESTEEPLATCVMCECDLYEGEDVYCINGEYICENCIEEYYKEYKVTL